MRNVRVGDVEIVALPDGAADLPRLPVGDDAPDLAPYAARYPDAHHAGADAVGHGWRVHVTCYLIRSAGRTILADTGVGPWPYKRYRGIEGALDRSLAAAGARDDEVDIVFMTHAHPDHVGWNATDEGVPRFRGARYVLHGADWREFGERERQPNYVGRSLTPLLRHGVLDLLEGERALTPQVTAIETPGHTPGHMSLLVRSGGEAALITGDAFCHPLYLTEPEQRFTADLDHGRAVATRRALLQRIEAEGWRIAACHFPEPGFGELVRIEGRRWFRAL